MHTWTLVALGRGAWLGSLAVVALAGCGNPEVSSLPPDPWLVMEPHDSTSLVSEVPIRAVLTATCCPPPFEHTLLETIASSLSLVELPSATPVGFTTTIEEMSAIIRDNFTDYVEVTPSIPLAPERWYELRLAPTPAHVRVNPEGMRDLSGGGVATRFTTGSHPTLQYIDGGLKDPGVFSGSITLSEMVNLTADIATQLRLEPLDPSGTCVLNMPNVPLTSVSGFSFRCELADNRIGTFAFFAAQSITSPAGASFEVSPGVPGDYALLIDVSMWRGCGYIDHRMTCGRVVPP